MKVEQWLIYYGTFTVHMKASVLGLNIETWGLAYRMVSFGKLAIKTIVDKDGFHHKEFIVCLICFKSSCDLDLLKKMKIARKGLLGTKCS